MDKWGKEELDAGEELVNVRIEPSRQIIRDGNGAEIQLAATLFFDCRNSRPKEIEIHVDDIIDFNGHMNQVASGGPLYDGKKLHHYEIGLVKYGKN